MTQSLSKPMQFRSLESLRGLAALAVCLFHSIFSTPGGSLFVANSAIFVDLFFVLSGFVMAYAYLEKVQSGLGFQRFALLRIGRLYPLHLFMLLLWLPYIALKAYRYHVLGASGGDDPLVENNVATFFSNFLLVNGLGLHDTQSWNYPAWTISVELFTYFVFFALVASLGRRYRPAYALATSVLAYAVLFAVSDTTLLKSVDFGFFRCVGGFFMGVWIHSACKSLRSIQVSPAMGSSVELLTVAATVAMVFFCSISKVLELLAFATFGILILVFTVSTQGIVSRLLGSKPMVLIGTLSYSIYMVHALVFNVILNVWEYVLKLPVTVKAAEGAGKIVYTTHAAVLNVAALALIAGIAYLTYTFVEKPWRERFRAWSQSVGAGRGVQVGAQPD